MARGSSPISMVSHLARLVRDVRLAWCLMGDERVPRAAKVIPFFLLFYIVVPIDLCPDFVPMLGHLDELAVILLGLRLFIRLCPKLVAQEYRAKMGCFKA
ncbi:MAG: DUF1232 domain-containing protein [Chloroflexota bacterium]